MKKVLLLIWVAIMLTISCNNDPGWDDRDYDPNNPNDTIPAEDTIPKLPDSVITMKK